MPHDDDTPPLTPAGVMRLAADHLDELEALGANIRSYNTHKHDAGQSVHLHPATDNDAAIIVGKYVAEGWSYTAFDTSIGFYRHNDDTRVMVSLDADWPSPFAGAIA